MNKKIFVAGAALSIVALSACGNSRSDQHRGYKDAPVNHKVACAAVSSQRDGQNNCGANIINEPNHFPNIAFKCNGKDGVYVTDRDGGYFVVVPNDPQCA